MLQPQITKHATTQISITNWIDQPLINVFNLSSRLLLHKKNRLLDHYHRIRPRRCHWEELPRCTERRDLWHGNNAMPASMTTRSEHGEAIAKPVTMPIWRRIYEGGDMMKPQHENTRGRHGKQTQAQEIPWFHTRSSGMSSQPRSLAIAYERETQDSREGILPEGSSNSVRGAHSKKKCYI